MEIINIKPDIINEEIFKRMKEINEKIKKKEYINKEKNKRRIIGILWWN